MNKIRMGKKKCEKNALSHKQFRADHSETAQFVDNPFTVEIFKLLCADF